jgi:hypothetical protein
MKNKSTFQQTPDWGSYRSLIWQLKHYYAPEHRVANHDKELPGVKNESLMAFGFSGSPSQIVHPLERGFYKFWKARGGVKGLKAPFGKVQVEKFLENYDPKHPASCDVEFPPELSK